MFLPHGSRRACTHRCSHPLCSYKIYWELPAARLAPRMNSRKLTPLPQGSRRACTHESHPPATRLSPHVSLRTQRLRVAWRTPVVPYHLAPDRPSHPCPGTSPRQEGHRGGRIALQPPTECISPRERAKAKAKVSSSLWARPWVEAGQRWRRSRDDRTELLGARRGGTRHLSTALLRLLWA